ncbi:MAG: hypothetical protein ACRD2L_01465 [Terriglobia bacterium]
MSDKSNEPESEQALLVNIRYLIEMIYLIVQQYGKDNCLALEHLKSIPPYALKNLTVSWHSVSDDDAVVVVGCKSKEGSNGV